MVSTIKRNELIKCRECEYEFGEDEAEVCRRCHEHICPKCFDCGCDNRDIRRNPIAGRWR